MIRVRECTYCSGLAPADKCRQVPVSREKLKTVRYYCALKPSLLAAGEVVRWTTMTTPGTFTERKSVEGPKKN